VTARGAVGPGVRIDPARAVATCFKPAEGDSAGLILRFQETTGRSGPLRIQFQGYRKAVQTDLLERDVK